MISAFCAFSPSRQLIPIEIARETRLGAEKLLPMKTSVSSLLVGSIRHLIGADQYPSHWRAGRNPFALKDLPCARTRSYKILPLSSGGHGVSRLAENGRSPHPIVWEAIFSS